MRRPIVTKRSTANANTEKSIPPPRHVAKACDNNTQKQFQTTWSHGALAGTGGSNHQAQIKNELSLKEGIAMSGAKSSEMDLEAEGRKRQKEEQTPSSMERQTKTKKGEEEKDEQKEEQEDIERTSRELFPTTPSAYKTFYTKEHSKGKEPRWKPQQANIEERSMQAKTPHTAKKETASSNEATDLSKQLTEQIREAQETMAKMQAAMENNSQPPFVQEMQQHILNLQQNMKEVQQHNRGFSNDIRDVDILTQHVHDTLYSQQQREAAKQTWQKDGRNTLQMRSVTTSSAGMCKKLESKDTTAQHMADTCTADTEDHQLPSFIGTVHGQSSNLRHTFTSATTNNTR